MSAQRPPASAAEVLPLHWASLSPRPRQPAATRSWEREVLGPAKQPTWAFHSLGYAAARATHLGGAWTRRLRSDCLRRPSPI